MYMIVGLGNPGDKYKKTRHNVGFIFLDFFKLRNSLDEFKKKDNYLFSKGRIDNIDVVLIKPQTFMNLSGQGLTKAMSFFKIPVSDIIIVYDDISLPFGKIRIRETGSSGGHNGIKSIEKELGTKDYKRVKIGIDPPPFPDMLPDFVLGDFSKEQLDKLQQNILIDVENAVNLMTKGNMSGAMNEYN